MWPPPDPTRANWFETFDDADAPIAADWATDAEFVLEYELLAAPWWRQQSAIVAASSGVVLALVGIVAISLFAGGRTEGTDDRLPERIPPSSSLVLITTSTITTTTLPATSEPTPNDLAVPATDR